MGVFHARLGVGLLAHPPLRGHIAVFKHVSTRDIGGRAGGIHRLPQGFERGVGQCRRQRGCPACGGLRGGSQFLHPCGVRLGEGRAVFFRKLCQSLGRFGQVAQQHGIHCAGVGRVRHFCRVQFGGSRLETFGGQCGKGKPWRKDGVYPARCGLSQ